MLEQLIKYYNRYFPAILAILIVASAVGIVYLSVTPGVPREGYTELYLLNSDGQASEYPTNITTDERQTIRVGISNKERQAMTYSIVMRLDGEKVTSRTVALEPGELREEKFSFTPRQPGNRQLDVHLHTGQSTDTTPYRSVGLQLSVDN